MVLLASSRLLETASVHLRRRPQRSRLPGPVSPPRPGPGSSGRPRHQEAAATATRPQTPLTGRRPTGRSFSGRRVASTGDRGLGRRPGWPRLLAPRPACARARSRTPLSQLPRGLLSRPRGSLTSGPGCRGTPFPLPPGRSGRPCARALPSSAASDSWVSLLLSLPSPQQTRSGPQLPWPAAPNPGPGPRRPAGQGPAKERPSCDPAGATQQLLSGVANLLSLWSHRAENPCPLTPSPPAASCPFLWICRPLSESIDGTPLLPTVLTPLHQTYLNP